ncbi:MAG: hypothetical protein SF029_17095 [bacterium]|nr:hypothetical protein [bacterium]
MPITLSWFNTEKTILYEHFHGTITLQDYYVMVDEAAALLEECPYPVHILADMGGLNQKTLPTNLLLAAKYADKRLPPNQGIVVYVRPGSFINSIIQISRRAGLQATRHLYTAQSLDEAVQLIAEKAPDLFG